MRFTIYWVVLSIQTVFIGFGCSNSQEVSGISPGNTTYYVNPTEGNDSNSGLAESASWQTFTQINQMRLSPGDQVEITAGSFDQSLILTGEGTAANPVKIHFAKGRFDFHPDNVFRERYNISNTNTMPDSMKAVGILLKKAKYFELSGVDAEIIYRGKMIEVCIDSSENVTISDLHFDYHRPTVSEFKVVELGDGYAEIEIHKDSKYRIENEDIIWYGEGWTYNTPILAQELNLDSNDVRRLWNPVKGMRFKR